MKTLLVALISLFIVNTAQASQREVDVKKQSKAIAMMAVEKVIGPQLKTALPDVKANIESMDVIADQEVAVVKISATSASHGHLMNFYLLIVCDDECKLYGIAPVLDAKIRKAKQEEK